MAYEEQAQKDRTRILDQSDNKSEIDALRESNKIDEDRSRRLQESIDKTSDQISKQKGLFTSRRVLTDKLKTDQASLQSINAKISENFLLNQNSVADFLTDIFDLMKNSEFKL